jgi:hypothetical protein
LSEYKGQANKKLDENKGFNKKDSSIEPSFPLRNREILKTVLKSQYPLDFKNCTDTLLSSTVHAMEN